jgi:anti-anti-sigma factor
VCKVVETVTSTLNVDADTAIVAFGGELDLDAAPQMRARLDEAFTTDGVTQILVDLAAAEFVDSTALGALMAAHNRAVQSDIKYRVINVPTRVERLLAITGTLTLLTGAEDLNG